MSQPHPPGWHPVPGTDNERYWDGVRWTDAYRPLGTGLMYENPYLNPYANPPGMYPAAPPETHGPAVASMVLGIVSLAICYIGIVTGIVGLILGLTSLKEVQPRGPKQGRSMAIAGIVCSIVALALWVAVLVFLFVVNWTWNDS